MVGLLHFRPVGLPGESTIILNGVIPRDGRGRVALNDPSVGVADCPRGISFPSYVGIFMRFAPGVRVPARAVLLTALKDEIDHGS